jgi:hypothetical protein
MLCPTSPSLPWVAWVSLPHVPRYSATLRLPPVPLGVLRLSLVPRYLACFSLFVVSPQGSWSGRSAQSTPGPLVTRSPNPGIASRSQVALPRSPCADMPRSSGRNTARATLGREFPTCTFAVCAAGSSCRHSSRFHKPPSHPGRSDVPRPVGSQRSACVISATPSPIDRGLRARPHTPLIRREARGCAPDLLARLESGGTCTSQFSPPGNHQPISWVFTHAQGFGLPLARASAGACYACAVKAASENDGNILGYTGTRRAFGAKLCGPPRRVSSMPLKGTMRGRQAPKRWCLAEV